jgi:hypothetical protein
MVFAPAVKESLRVSEAKVSSIVCQEDDAIIRVIYSPMFAFSTASASAAQRRRERWTKRGQHALVAQHSEPDHEASVRADRVLREVVLYVQRLQDTGFDERLVYPPARP